MRGYLRRFGLILTTVICALTVAMPAVYAATGDTGTTTGSSGPFNVIVSPISQQLEIKPSGSATATIQVQNKSNTVEHIKAAIYTFGANGDDGTPSLSQPKSTDEFIKWATLSTQQFDAEPNVWTNVKLTVNPPKTAAFGYYYAVIFSRANQPTVSKKANLQGAVASLILVNVQAPGAKREVSIAEFSTARKSTEFLPANFKVRLHNTGNTHVAPRGNIFIKKGDKNLALLEVNLEKGQILPKTYRAFDAQWNDGSPAYKQKVVNGKAVVGTDGKPVTGLDWSNFSMSKLRFGRYTAKLVMVYNNGHNDISSTAELSFWVIPWRIIGLAFLVLIVIAAGLWSLVVRPIRRRVKHQGRGPVSFR